VQRNHCDLKSLQKSLRPMLLLALFFVSCSEDPITAFKNVNLVPMTGEKVVKSQTVLVKDKRIIEIRRSDEIAVPKNAKIIESSGAYLMPGLADMHMHTRDDWLSPAWPVSPFDLYLANGVTTIRCFGPAGDSPNYLLAWRDAINRGKLSGPTVITCGSVLYGPVEDPQKFVREQKEGGFDFLKIYSFVSKDEFHKAMMTAKQLGFYTAGHIPFSVGLDGVLSEGMDEIAHIEELDFEFADFDRTKKLGRVELFRYIIHTAAKQHQAMIGLDIWDLDERYGDILSAAVDKLRSTNVPVCTTLVVGEGIVKKLHETDAFLARPENKYLCKGYLEDFRNGKEKHLLIFKGYEDFASFKYNLERMLLVKLKKAAIPLLLSTDAGSGGMGIVPGFSIHDELRILIDNGFTPYEAIATGTVNASKVIQAMTGTDDFGTIEIGKRADLLLVENNPLDNVANIRNLRGVMAAGRWYSKDRLQEMIALKK
jgi:imidazolonepropionase-like amidohydrolase